MTSAIYKWRGRLGVQFFGVWSGVFLGLQEADTGVWPQPREHGLGFSLGSNMEACILEGWGQPGSGKLVTGPPVARAAAGNWPCCGSLRNLRRGEKGPESCGP